MASGGNDGSANMLKLATMTLFSKLGRGIACLLSIQSKQGECAITSDYTVLYYIVNIASILVLYWHPLVSLEFEGGDPKAKYYDIYKVKKKKKKKKK
jgi:hypothetical protein